MPKPAAVTDLVRGTRLFCGLTLALFTSSVNAQDRTAWSVYVQENPTQCWVTSIPAGTVATRDGQDVSDAISRDEAILFISFWPDDTRLGEVSYTGGYPFADGSTVAVVVGDATFEFFTDGPMAWAGSPQADARLVAAMRDGSEVVVTAVSGRGTEVVDTFSLTGFTAAIDDAVARCSS